uniref:Uncharacterized protein n=1 Tax=Arundo donax TaxID=35708 RepID=A0A0A8ZQQ4_ARUDO
MIQSAVFIALAVVGAVTVVFLSCAFLTGCLLAETVARSLNAAAGHGTGNAAAGQGEGITVYVAATNGPAPVWSVVAQLRFY